MIRKKLFNFLVLSERRPSMLRRFMIIAMIASIAVATLTPTSSEAQGPAVRISYEITDRTDTVVVFALKLQNRHATPIHNVLVRPQSFAHPDIYHVEIGPGETVTSEVEMAFDRTQEPRALVWHVQFTDASGQLVEEVFE